VHRAELAEAEDAVVESVARLAEQRWPARVQPDRDHDHGERGRGRGRQSQQQQRCQHNVLGALEYRLGAGDWPVAHVEERLPGDDAHRASQQVRDGLVGRQPDIHRDAGRQGNDGGDPSLRRPGQRDDDRVHVMPLDANQPPQLRSVNFLL
jgi:hypothetical protein